MSPAIEDVSIARAREIAVDVSSRLDFMGFETHIVDISRVSDQKIICGLTEYYSDQIPRVIFYLKSMIESWRLMKFRIESARYFNIGNFKDFVSQTVIHEHRHVQQFMFLKYLGGDEFLEFMLARLMQIDYDESPIEIDAYQYQLDSSRSIMEILNDPIILNLIHEFETL